MNIPFLADIIQSILDGFNSGIWNTWYDAPDISWLKEILEAMIRFFGG